MPADCMYQDGCEVDCLKTLRGRCNFAMEGRRGHDLPILQRALLTAKGNSSTPPRDRLASVGCASKVSSCLVPLTS